MSTDDAQSLGDDATFTGAMNRHPASEVSFGDEYTLGDKPSGQETVIDDIEIVDLEARYRMESTLGQGGMGAVLLATDTRLGRKVAIKRILADTADNVMAVQRFLTEAKAIAALNHPNIVQIYDSGRSKEGPYLIMEYVDGGSLLDCCRNAALPLDEAMRLAYQLCDGLTLAHEAGIIHRDIKPANVLLTKAGIPKLSDFGLAKVEAGTHGQTMTGVVLGTPDFMSPEQRRDASLVDHRSDLWSLAATIYQMVTGRVPKVIRLDDLPAAIQNVLARALEDSKETRYQSVSEFRYALEQAVSHGVQQTPMPGGHSECWQEGQCPACHTVNADVRRKFCRNPVCGASLRTTCLNCDEQIPVWESICGECGGNQSKILIKLRSSLTDQCLTAKEQLAKHLFDDALASSQRISETRLPQLRDLADWGKSFIDTVNEARERETRVAAERLREAEAHKKAFDYPAALKALESIPGSLRTTEITDALASCRRLQREAVRIIKMIADRIKRKELDDLLPMVEQAIAIRGDRQDLATIRQQLIERRDRQLAKSRGVLSAQAAADVAAAVDAAVLQETEAEERISSDIKNGEVADLPRARQVNPSASRDTEPPQTASGKITNESEFERDKVDYGLEISADVIRSVGCSFSLDPQSTDWSPTLGPLIPATIVVDAERNLLIGHEAATKALRSDVSVARSLMHLVGRSAKLDSRRMHRHDDALLAINDDQALTLALGGCCFRIDEVVGFVLTKAAEALHKSLGAAVAGVVMAVPASWGTLGRSMLTRGAVSAGLNAIRLIATSQAEALACYWEFAIVRGDPIDSDKHHLVVHWDNSCCEVTVFTAAQGVVEVHSTSGDDTLGAHCCKQRLADLLVAELGSGVVAAQPDSLTRRWLWSLAEQLHQQLREAFEASVALPGLPTASRPAEPRHTCVTRRQYKSLCEDVFSRIRRLVSQALGDSKSSSELGAIFLTGTESRSPDFRSMIGEMFPGAAVRSPRDPECTAAWGASLLGSTLNGLSTDLLLLNILTHSIGIETEGGTLTRLVERNTSIPTERKSCFVPTKTDVSRLCVRIFEGEHPMAADNELIGAFCCTQSSMPSGRKTTPSIVVKADIDAGGRISITISEDGGEELARHSLPFIEPIADDASDLAEEWDDDSDGGDAV